MNRIKSNIRFFIVCILCVCSATFLLGWNYYKICEDENTWRNKRAIVLGNSIAQGTLVNGGNEPWIKTIEKNMGLLIDNEAVSGTAVGLCEGYGMDPNYNDFSLCKIVNWKPFENYDVCLIVYGTIDYFYQMELGEPDYMDCSTFYGAFNYSIQKIMQVNPDMEIILLTPLYNFQAETENERNQTMDEYREAIGIIAKNYGLKLIDMKGVLMDAALYNQENMAYPNAEGYEKMRAYLEMILREEAYSPYPETEYHAKNLLKGMADIFENANEGILELSGIQVEYSLQDLELDTDEFYYITIEYDSPVDDWLQVDFWNERRQEMTAYRVFPIEAGEDRIRRIKIAGPDRDVKGAKYNLRIGTCYDGSSVRIKQIMMAEENYCK